MKLEFGAIVSLLCLAVFSGNAAARDLQAQLDWAEKYIVSFPVNGAVKRVYVSAGQHVAEGAPLVELDAEPFRIRLRQHEAAVAARGPVLAEAQREYEQARSLYEQTVLSDVELQRTQHAFEQARAELAQAEAALQLSRWRLNKTSSVAPWDGWVLLRDVEPGQMLVDEQRAEPLLVLGKAGAMIASAMLTAAEIRPLRTGQQLKVQVDNQAYEAEVVSLALQPETSIGESHYRLEARFEMAQDERFRAGQAAVIKLP